MSIAVDIDRIVIDDPTLVPGRAERLRLLVADEVRRLLEGAPPSTQPRERRSVRARPLRVVPETEQTLARELAARIVESLGETP